MISQFTSRFPEQSAEIYQKRTFLFYCLIICIPCILIFAVDDFLNDRELEGFINLLATTIFSFSLIALKYVKDISNVFRMSALVVLIQLTYQVATGGGEGYAILWYYVFPMTAIYLTNAKEGLVWILSSIAITIFVYLYPVGYEFESSLIIRFLVTYSIVAILSFGLESSRNKYYNQLIEEKEQLEKAISEVKTLQNLLPICSYCKSIRDDKGYWNQLESYLDEHAGAQFSHGICPECTDKHFKEYKINQPD